MQQKRLERQQKRKKIKFSNEDENVNVNGVKNAKSVEKKSLNKRTVVHSKEDFEEDADSREEDGSDSESELGQDSDNESTASVTLSDSTPSSEDLFSAIFTDENTDLLNYNQSSATSAANHQVAIDQYAQVHDILKRVIVSTPNSQIQTAEQNADGNLAKVPTCLEDPVDVNVDLLEKGEVSA